MFKHKRIVDQKLRMYIVSDDHVRWCAAFAFGGALIAYIALWGAVYSPVSSLRWSFIALSVGGIVLCLICIYNRLEEVLRALAIWRQLRRIEIDHNKFLDKMQEYFPNQEQELDKADTST